MEDVYPRLTVWASLAEWFKPTCRGSGCASAKGATDAVETSHSSGSQANMCTVHSAVERCMFQLQTGQPLASMA